MADPTPDCQPASKREAILGDQLLSMPRRRVLAKDIKHEVAIGDSFLVVPDHNSPHDTVFQDDAQIDLAEGNAFRVIPTREASFSTPFRDPAKLTFSVDDSLNVTINPDHTPESLQHPFGLLSSVSLEGSVPEFRNADR